MGTGVGEKHKRGRNTEIFKNQRIKYANKGMMNRSQSG